MVAASEDATTRCLNYAALPGVAKPVMRTILHAVLIQQWLRFGSSLRHGGSRDFQAGRR
jgi:hypothetical protein